MLGDRSVTWMRGRDLHILTVGLVTYSADERFQVLHTQETDDWTLQVQYSQPRDSGTYKCQVNSDPKIVRNVFLTVTDKRYLDGQLYRMPATSNKEGEYGTHIVGGGARFLQAGSSLSLECIVTHTRAPPTAVLWYHGNRVLDYDSPRGGISLQVSTELLSGSVPPFPVTSQFFPPGSSSSLQVPVLPFRFQFFPSVGAVPICKCQ
nr:zwei Ig domain protein zig-8-like [Procambarus clarkii]